MAYVVDGWVDGVVDDGAAAECGVDDGVVADGVADDGDKMAFGTNRW